MGKFKLRAATFCIAIKTCCVFGSLMYSIRYEPGYVGGWIESCSYFKSVTESTEGSLQSEETLLVWWSWMPFEQHG